MTGKSYWYRQPRLLGDARYTNLTPAQRLMVKEIQELQRDGELIGTEADLARWLILDAKTTRQGLAAIAEAGLFEIDHDGRFYRIWDPNGPATNSKRTGNEPATNPEPSANEVETNLKPAPIDSRNDAGSSDHSSHIKEENRLEEKREETPNPLPESEDEKTARFRSLSIRQFERFSRFWEKYPKKRGKGAAERAWSKIKPDEMLFQVILAALDHQRGSPDWIKAGGRFVPNPATWLNERRWEDDDGTDALQPQAHWADGYLS